ncbi:uncharacterized protein N7511_009555 [Penicillium nucicola]|uniref:uncharacterized protein n=1 Tax=Penicillium nucicola TaxID=1850975 RepID=UPI00254519E1|nr:uncharacterized protein N7511_009555 [Penicillium nucicola]KAJ5747859.1 hypothetical protein N7511_009555 [Penicillium nucicola]
MFYSSYFLPPSSYSPLVLFLLSQAVTADLEIILVGSGVGLDQARGVTSVTSLATARVAIMPLAFAVTADLEIILVGSGVILHQA